MNKIKLLIPALSIASVAGIVTPLVTSCNKDKGDGFVAIPTDKLNITDGALEGLKDTVTDLTGYSKLTIGKDIISVGNFQYKESTDKRLSVVQKVDFEERTKAFTFKDYAFSSLPNLKIIEFPSDCSKITMADDSFEGCVAIEVLDFSKVTSKLNATFTSASWLVGCKEKGKFYANKDNKATIENLRNIMGFIETDWPVEVK